MMANIFGAYGASLFTRDSYGRMLMKVPKRCSKVTMRQSDRLRRGRGLILWAKSGILIIFPAASLVARLSI